MKAKGKLERQKDHVAVAKSCGRTWHTAGSVVWQEHTVHINWERGGGGDGRSDLGGVVGFIMW